MKFSRVIQGFSDNLARNEAKIEESGTTQNGINYLQILKNVGVFVHGGHSSVGRASASQATPLIFLTHYNIT
jgi:hypothetical protein